MATQNLSANELRDYAKFNGINFPQWRYGVMLKLRRKKLEKLVLGQDPKPAETFNDENEVTNQDVIDTWIERDTDACSIIYYNIEPIYQTSIKGSATSAEMWNRLAQEYAQVAVANSSQLTAKFFQYLMDPGHTVSAHVNRMRQMAEELKSVEAPVTDQQLIERILQTLPPSYYNFISAWESVPLAERSISSLTSRLILEETRMKSRTNGPNPADIAFLRLTRTTSNSRQLIVIQRTPTQQAKVIMVLEEAIQA
ncbi:uncharacterized protein LOC116934903 [Daphnia magna]|uniref:uncharacterized protein LOC116934903 n=1 Tax=Daphnia magna TaxID=35525 RepID=UPI001E1BA41F|nr:uncharacterized protein LOC116934903 [Daphnia magna]